MIKLKEGTAKWEHFGEISPKLGEVFFSFYSKLKDYGVNDITVTSIIRHKADDSGVHAVGRAIDIRADFDYNSIGKYAMEYINQKYTYDIARGELKTCVYHSTSTYGDEGLHYHLQTRK